MGLLRKKFNFNTLYIEAILITMIMFNASDNNLSKKVKCIVYDNLNKTF